MCYYITAVVDKCIESTEVNLIGEKYGFLFEDCNNQFVVKQLPHDIKYMIKNSYQCDCGTEIGSITYESKDNQRTEKKELDTLKKKGWSETKIKRWVKDKKKIENRSERINKEDLNRKHLQISFWISFIIELFEKTSSHKFGLLLHWYQKGVENERISIKEIKKLTLVDLSEEILLKAKEDHIYLFERK